MKKWPSAAIENDTEIYDKDINGKWIKCKFCKVKHKNVSDTEQKMKVLNLELDPLHAVCVVSINDTICLFTFNMYNYFVM